jgi:ubiquinone/menaquinone biosynthesis C-methylase UbiE
MKRAIWIVHILVVLALVAAIPALGQNTANESRREQWQKVDEIFKAMGVAPGAKVADVGAGMGFFTARLSRAVGDQGRVYAVDIDPAQIRRLRERVTTEDLSNVEVVEGAADDPKLPPGTLDAALIVNAYHEMKDHRAMLARIRAALKPEGRLVIIEPITPARRGRTREDQVRSHEIDAEHVQQEAREAGFRVARLEDPFTKRQSGRDEEWLLVLTPSPAAPAVTTERPALDRTSDEWKSPDLRITIDEFKRLAADGKVLVVDVRDQDSYRDGHLPGAILLTLEEIVDGKGAERLRDEPRLIVTYCS